MKTDIKDRTYAFALEIIKFLDKLDKKDFIVDILSKQLLRSSTSIGANILEAQAGSTRKDFINFYYYALKSSNETKFWLRLLKDSKKVQNHQTDQLLKEAEEISNILGACIISLKKS